MDISYLATTLEHCTKDLLKVCLPKKERVGSLSSIICFSLPHDYLNRLGKTEITANDIDLVMNADPVEVYSSIPNTTLSLSSIQQIFVEILRLDLNAASPTTPSSILQHRYINRHDVLQ